MHCKRRQGIVFKSEFLLNGFSIWIFMFLNILPLLTDNLLCISVLLLSYANKQQQQGFLRLTLKRKVYFSANRITELLWSHFFVITVSKIQVAQLYDISFLNSQSYLMTVVKIVVTNHGLLEHLVTSKQK